MNKEIRIESTNEALRRLEFVREQNNKRNLEVNKTVELPKAPEFIKEYAREKK